MEEPSGLGGPPTGRASKSLRAVPGISRGSGEAFGRVNGGERKLMRTILLILLILLLLGALPAWPYSHGWGYYPSGGLLLIVILVLLFVRV